jgi:hypothetical protein
MCRLAPAMRRLTWTKVWALLELPERGLKHELGRIPEDFPEGEESAR